MDDYAEPSTGEIHNALGAARLTIGGVGDGRVERGDPPYQSR